MGICIQKNLENLEAICSKEPQFQVDKSKHNTKSLAVWEITQNSCDSLKWPFVFHSTSSYILIIVGSSQLQTPLLQQDRTSIQLAEMLFGAQFLCLHIKVDKKIMLNNKEYDMSIYSFYGDSEQDDLIARARLAYYTQLLQKYLQFGAGYFCLLLLNQSEPVVFKNQLKQFIDFESEQYSQAHSHIFFKEQLFGNKISLKETINESIDFLRFANFVNGFEKLPHIDIKEQKLRKQMKMNKKRQLDQSLPFACEITQIDIKGGTSKVPKLQAGNIDESNVLFEELGMNGQSEQLNKMEEFLKGLYLGTEKVSKDYSTLNEKKIKIIVNCAASYCKNWFVADINYIWIDMPDPTQHTRHFNIQCLIYNVADLIGKCLAEHSGVLIHCTGYNPKIDESGSRSAIILMGVLMSSLKISYDDAFSMVSKKWKIKIPLFLQKQLKDMQKRRKQKTKGFYVYSICSYSTNFPKHIVAKYICEIQSIQNIQGIDDFEKHVFLCVGPSACKIMKGRLCENQEEYEKYAKQHLRLLTKYEGYNSQAIVEPIQKTFRKQTKIQLKQQILHIPLKGKQKYAGFLRNQQIVLKYPILRPVWQKKKQDAFYFTIRQKPQGAEVMMNKGMKWIGYEEDKQKFFEKLITCYLGHVPHDKIFIMESEQDQSLFDSSQINI